MIRCSISFSGVVRMGASGPSVLVISFRFMRARINEEAKIGVDSVTVALVDRIKIGVE